MRLFEDLMGNDITNAAALGATRIAGEGAALIGANFPGIALPFSISPFVFWPYFAGAVFLLIGILALRKDVSSAHRIDKVVVLGRLFFAVPLAVFGAQHLVGARFVMETVPAWIPGRLFWTYLVGFALFAAALSILLKRVLLLSSTLLAIMLSLFVLLIHIPNALSNPGDRFLWAVALRDLTFAAAALALAGTQTEEWRTRGTNKLITVARYLIAIPLVLFGVEHFLHPEFAPGVPLKKVTPDWIPGRLIVSYLTGLVLVVAGLGVLWRTKTRLAATSLGVMILFLTVFIYLPIVLVIRTDTGAMVEGMDYLADTLFFGGMSLVFAYAMPREASAATDP